MCPALRYDQTRQRATTARTVTTCATIDGQQILIRANGTIGLAILDVTKAGATPLDGLAQDRDNARVQLIDLISRQRTGGSQRMDPRAPQRFVGVDIAQPGDESLVEQQRLDTPSSSTEHLRQSFRSESSGQRLWTQVPHYLLWIVHQIHPSELARVGKYQPAPVVKLKANPDVRIIMRTDTAGQDK